jgi:hypothetical protein
VSGPSAAAQGEGPTPASSRTRAARGDHRRRPGRQAPPASERLVVITFLWQGMAGAQPVLYVDRTLLD